MGNRTKFMLIGGVVLAAGVTAVAALSTAQAAGPEVTVYRSPT